MSSTGAVGVQPRLLHSGFRSLPSRASQGTPSKSVITSLSGAAEETAAHVAKVQQHVPSQRAATASSPLVPTQLPVATSPPVKELLELVEKANSSSAPPSTIGQPTMSSGMRPVRLLPSQFGSAPAKASRQLVTISEAAPGQVVSKVEPEVHALVMSLGSGAHFEGKCKPCLFWYEGHCTKGETCQFCHIPHDAQQVRRVRPSKKTRERLRKVHNTSQNDAPAEAQQGQQDQQEQQIVYEEGYSYGQSPMSRYFEGSPAPCRTVSTMLPGGIQPSGLVGGQLQGEFFRGENLSASRRTISPGQPLTEMTSGSPERRISQHFSPSYMLQGGVEVLLPQNSRTMQQRGPVASFQPQNHPDRNMQPAPVPGPWPPKNMQALQCQEMSQYGQTAGSFACQNPFLQIS